MDDALHQILDSIKEAKADLSNSIRDIRAEIGTVWAEMGHTSKKINEISVDVGILKANDAKSGKLHDDVQRVDQWVQNFHAQHERDKEGRGKQHDWMTTIVFTGAFGLIVILALLAIFVAEQFIRR